MASNGVPANKTKGTNPMSTFTLSIEDTYGHSFQHGFHLGTDKALARQIAEERFHARIKHGLPVVTVALIRERKLVDCFDGEWESERQWWDEVI